MKTDTNQETSLKHGDELHIEHHEHAYLVSFTRGTQSLYFRDSRDNKAGFCSEQSVLDTMRLITGLTGLSFKFAREERGIKTYTLV